MMLRVDRLSVDIDDQRLLSDISFTLNSFDYLCILGQNGAGKSTLLKALMGILPHTSGHISIDGQALDALSQRQLAQRISYVAQTVGHGQDIVVADFIKLARYSYQSAFSNWQHRDQVAYDRAIELTDVGDFLSRHLASLSGGERQRVMIAAALCQQTPLLLLDEPSNFLDPHHQWAIQQLIQDLSHQQHLCIIEVTHDINHALEHSDHLLALKSGRALWFGPTNTFSTESLLSELYDHDFILTSHPHSGKDIVLSGGYQS